MRQNLTDTTIQLGSLLRIVVDYLPSLFVDQRFQLADVTAFLVSLRHKCQCHICFANRVRCRRIDCESQLDPSEEGLGVQCSELLSQFVPFRVFRHRGTCSGRCLTWRGRGCWGRNRRRRMLGLIVSRGGSESSEAGQRRKCEQMALFRGHGTPPSLGRNRTATTQATEMQRRSTRSNTPGTKPAS